MKEEKAEMTMAGPFAPTAASSALSGENSTVSSAHAPEPSLAGLCWSLALHTPCARPSRDSLEWEMNRISAPGTNANEGKADDTGAELWFVNGRVEAECWPNTTALREGKKRVDASIRTTSLGVPTPANEHTVSV